MIQIYTNRITPETTAPQFETSQKQLEAIFPLKADKIDEVNQEAIIPDGTRWGPDMLDIPALRDALANGASTLDLTKQSSLLGLVVQYKDGISFYVTPGQVLLNGVLKLQELDENTDKIRIVNAAVSLIPGECQPSTPGVSGLDPDTWYYVYADTSVATTYPDYKVTATRWVWGGRGPLHPENDKLRGIASLRTDEDGNIRAFARYDTGWVFWREILVGPGTPTDDRGPSSSGFVTVYVNKWVPPTADCAHLTILTDASNSCVRVKGDVESRSGYSANGTGGTAIGYSCPVPVNIIDTVTDEQVVGVEVDADSASASPFNIAVAGYHEPII